jgi:hypothetical protein
MCGIVGIFSKYPNRQSDALPVGTKGRNHIIGLERREACSISAATVYFDKEF